MNAWTANDYTLYPFSTQNLKDYKNLMQVYLDAVFFPKLHQTDFEQEGWRLEHAQTGNASSPIVFKGVVYNEMKGAMSDVQNVFGQELMTALLPHSIYAPNSGGDPKDIPNLTWDQLKQYHRRYYHPSNTRFFSYGNMNLDDTLSQVNQVLNSTLQTSEVNLNPGNEIMDLPSMISPKEVEVKCAFDPSTLLCTTDSLLRSP
jgi:Zn-dependent M16 (insulinase) family peptidase